ncbi:MAG: hypothetical protein MI741_10415, partial [Rhodospirillales bacterium]|nr:hypothetical protein [Rhodospirillales bacterium]
MIQIDQNSIGETSSGGMVTVCRRPEKFISDDQRVITRFFQPGGEERARVIIKRVCDLDETEVERLFNEVCRDFSSRHRNIERIFERHYNNVRHCIDNPESLSRTRQLLLGSYFTMEYSIESAALFNPSIVPHIDQGGTTEGELRFLMSLRATGEGHVSSIVFRTGRVDATGSIRFDPASRYVAKLRVSEDQRYDKRLFFYKLIEMAAYSDAARVVLDELPDYFTLGELEHKLMEVRERENRPSPFSESAENMLWLARSNYSLMVPPDTDPGEIVIFPSSENESQGIEDVRLTRFIDDDGEATYFGTYTAYNGFRILPQLLETQDFRTIKIHTLNGKYVQNKGMALFPRKINGFYYMIGRLDGENMFLMRSDNVHFWNDAAKLQSPRYPWEFVQIGNCGPPIETDAGWLLLTHGVGPMREYCIGATLLDRDD